MRVIFTMSESRCSMPLLDKRSAPLCPVPPLCVPWVGSRYRNGYRLTPFQLQGPDMRRRLLQIFGSATLSLAVAACAAGPRVPQNAFPAPQKLTDTRGLETVLGRSERQLTRMFGEPRLTIPEGDALKLQYAGRACVLDVYLYPESAGAAPTATYVDARNADGANVDRAACVAALRR
jgi:hypothetical protein